MDYFLLFLSSFLAATVLPFSSEAHFVYLLSQESFSTTLLLLLATVGNTLGGILNFYLGWICKWEWIEKYLRIKTVKIFTFQQRISKFGHWLALLTWLPIVGDALAVALGVFKQSPIWCISFIFLGKFIRYFVLTLLANQLI